MVTIILFFTICNVIEKVNLFFYLLTTVDLKVERFQGELWRSFEVLSSYIYILKFSRKKRDDKKKKMVEKRFGVSRGNDLIAQRLGLCKWSVAHASSNSFVPWKYNIQTASGVRTLEKPLEISKRCIQISSLLEEIFVFHAV